MNTDNMKRSSLRQHWEHLIEQAEHRRGASLGHALRETIVADCKGHIVHLISRTEGAYAQISRNLQYLGRIMGDVVGEDLQITCIIELVNDHLSSGEMIKHACDGA